MKTFSIGRTKQSHMFIYGIPRDALPTPGGRHPAGLSSRWTKLHPLFVWDLATAGRVCAGAEFTLFRGAASVCIISAGRVCGRTEFHFYHGTSGLSQIPREKR